MFLLTSLQRHTKNIIIGAVILTALFPLSAEAQVIRGLEVTPFLIELDVPKGGTITSQIDLTNRSSEPLLITAAPRDFLPGEDGQPEFVPDTEINDKTFSLSSWVTLEASDRFTINPGQTVTVPFKVSPPINAEQGTHYGALLFTYISQAADGNLSEVQQSIGTILLVYYGQTRESGVVDLITDNKLYWQADKVTLTNLFQNIGNVHVKPKGEVYIKNLFGQTVATPFVNRDAANVLPRTNRGFVSTWYPSSLSFGPYFVETKIIYGPNRLEAKDRVIIWILPWYLVLATFFILAIIIWVIFHGRHLHKRRVIRKHLERTGKI
jgi:hypothetical protein